MVIICLCNPVWSARQQKWTRMWMRKGSNAYLAADVQRATPSLDYQLTANSVANSDCKKVTLEWDARIDPFCSREHSQSICRFELLWRRIWSECRSLVLNHVKTGLMRWLFCGIVSATDQWFCWQVWSSHSVISLYKVFRLTGVSCECSGSQVHRFDSCLSRIVALSRKWNQSVVWELHSDVVLKTQMSTRCFCRALIWFLEMAVRMLSFAPLVSSSSKVFQLCRSNCTNAEVKQGTRAVSRCSIIQTFDLWQRKSNPVQCRPYPLRRSPITSLNSQKFNCSFWLRSIKLKSPQRVNRFAEKSLRVRRKKDRGPAKRKAAAQSAYVSPPADARYLSSVFGDEDDAEEVLGSIPVAPRGPKPVITLSIVGNLLGKQKVRLALALLGLFGATTCTLVVPIFSGLCSSMKMNVMFQYS